VSSHGWHVIARCSRPPRRDARGQIIWRELTAFQVKDAKIMADKGSIMMASRFSYGHRDLVVKLRDSQQLLLVAPKGAA